MSLEQQIVIAILWWQNICWCHWLLTLLFYRHHTHRGSLSRMLSLQILRAEFVTIDFYVQLMVKKRHDFNIFFEFTPVPLEKSGIHHIFLFNVSLEPVYVLRLGKAAYLFSGAELGFHKQTLLRIQHSSDLFGNYGVQHLGKLFRLIHSAHIKQFTTSFLTTKVFVFKTDILFGGLAWFIFFRLVGQVEFLPVPLP